MASTFSTDFASHLLPTTDVHARPVARAPTDTEHILNAVLDELQPPFTEEAVARAIDTLKHLHEQDNQAQVAGAERMNELESALHASVVRKVVLGLYMVSLDVYLREAGLAQDDAEWWADIARSRRSSAMYLLQTLPQRVARALESAREATAQKASSFAQDPSAPLRIPFTLTLFPHTNTASSPSYGYTSSAALSKLAALRPEEAGRLVSRASRSLGRLRGALAAYVVLPITLARDECELRRRELTRIRDARAEALGRLLAARPHLEHALVGTHDGRIVSMGATAKDSAEVCRPCVTLLADALGEDEVLVREETTGDALGALIALRGRVFDRQAGQDGKTLYANRPSRLTLLWPRLVLVPPLALMAARYAWASRDSLREFASETVETARNFYKDWLVEPVRGVLHTIRAGSEGGIIVTKEAVDADLASLERMSLSLAQEKLKYTGEQLDELSRQIRTGDFTAVLRLYEEDIKTPLRSAVGGSLIRSVLVQVQKAKVDIDQALTGIDKLLKSQELTFAFVGVAPAFAIVYVAGGFLAGSLRGPGKRAFGGKRQRTGVWLAMRRIERLLIMSPTSSSTSPGAPAPPAPAPGSTAATKLAGPAHAHQGGDAIPPLTAGLLLLSATHLRQFAERSLPGRSRLREGFLEDVRDLEDPGLGRAEKLRVVDRMWRSWGETLGWTRQARI